MIKTNVNLMPIYRIVFAKQFKMIEQYVLSVKKDIIMIAMEFVFNLMVMKQMKIGAKEHL